jgi:hypothetical protein
VEVAEKSFRSDGAHGETPGRAALQVLQDHNDGNDDDNVVIFIDIVYE